MRYPLGTSVWLGGPPSSTGAATSLQVRDNTGALVDASTITFTLVKPDATTVNYSSPTHDGTGLYHQIVPLADTTQLGSYRWYVTVLVGANQAVLPHGSFDVFTPSEKGILTLDEGKAQLGIPSSDTSNDVELQAYIDAIGLAAENYKNEVIIQRSFTDDLDLLGYKRFWLRKLPVVSLTSVVSLIDGTVWDVSLLHVTGSSGRVAVVTGSYPRGLCAVTYVAGPALIPENYKRGAGVMLQDVWSTQRGMSSQPAFGGETTDLRVITTVSRRAMEWFGPPRAMVA
jgi:hypothetical protein